MNSPEPRKTALNAIHRDLGARMVDFAGWDMPLQYGSPIREHMAARMRAAVFDVSHMGEIELTGPTAEATLQRVACNDVRRLAAGQCHYSALTTPLGTFVDDILVYRFAADHFLLCVNASNQEKDYRWICEHAEAGTEVRFRSDDFSQLAVQGPRAAEILQPLADTNLSALRYYRFSSGRCAGVDAIISRTGYTGEDGFEIYASPAEAADLWTRVMEAGRPLGLEPAGLAARNTLRLEAGMALYGHDIDDTTTVLEANLAWICKLEKGDFIGREALLRQKEQGVGRRLAGFEMLERGIAREHYPILIDGRQVSVVSSGSPAPFLQKNIGLAYLPADRCGIGTEFHVLIRNKPVLARVVPTPFYRRGKAA